jgi:hypothetical protein
MDESLELYVTEDEDVVLMTDELMPIPRDALMRSPDMKRTVAVKIMARNPRTSVVCLCI